MSGSSFDYYHYWSGFSDFPPSLEGEDDPIIGRPICEACGWVGPPCTSTTALMDESYEHTCKLSVAEVIRQINAIRIPQEHELTIEPTFAEWLASL